jgi:hypothetical protein
MFRSDTQPELGHIRKPYWVTGPKCGHHQAGPELTYEEIVRYFGPEARCLAEGDDSKR